MPNVNAATKAAANSEAGGPSGTGRKIPVQERAGIGNPLLTSDNPVADLAVRLARAHARKSEAEAEVADLKAQIRELTEQAGEFSEGLKIQTPEGIQVASVRRSGRRFDPVKAATILPDSLVGMISTMQIDPKVAKIKLPTEAYEECLTDGGLTIVVK